MPEIKSLTDGSISIIDLLNDIKKGNICIGKPHFQRGLVWNTDLKTNLIESLMLDIPIGTFMLWENNSIDYGTPLHESENFKYLIIDGQQRLNTLWKFYNDIQKDIETDNEYENEFHWYINKRTIEEGKDFIKHIRIAGNTKDKDKLIPLNCFFPEGKTCRTKYEKEIAELNELPVCSISEILKKEIIIKIIKSENLPNIIDTYVKINSSGKPVKNEEKAYAKFVRLEDFSKEFNLKELFKSVHGEKDSDNELARKRENNFGFDVFLKILLQNFYYYFTFDPQRDKGFNFDRVDDIIENYDKLENKYDFIKIYKQSKIIIEFLAGEKNGIIRDQLKFDDLRFFPDSGFKCLQPIIQLMILYPESIEIENESTRNRFSYLALRLLIKNLPYVNDNENKNSIIGIIKEMNSKNSIDECVNLIEKQTEISHDELKTELMKIKAINNHYTDLLYGLERYLGARDVSIKNFDKEEKKRFIKYYKDRFNIEIDKDNSEMPLISLAIQPTKQHIIPATYLCTNRNKSGIWNNIGNLTYISDAMNRLNGLKEKFMELEYESTQNDTDHSCNSNKHCFSEEFIGTYTSYKKKIQKWKKQNESNGKDEIVNKVNLLKTNEKELLKYLKKRNKSISDKFLEWSNSLSPKNEQNGEDELTIHKVYEKFESNWLFKDRIFETYKNHEDFRIISDKSKNPIQIELGKVQIEITQLYPGDIIVIKVSAVNGEDTNYLKEFYTKCENQKFKIPKKLINNRFTIRPINLPNNDKFNYYKENVFDQFINITNDLKAEVY